MSNNHSSPPSLIPRPVAGNVVPEKEDPETGPNAEKPETSAEPIREDVSSKTEDKVVDEYEKLAASLRDYDWEQLQKKFTDAMDERSQAEMALQKETAELLEVGPA